MKKLGNTSILTIFLLTSSFSFGQTFLNASKKYIQTFDEINSETLSNHIDGIADSARIIGLGEVSHYTKECYELKHAIINRLIEKGFDALVLEVDFGQALLWNNYVVDGSGNVDSLIAQSGWFTYRTEEFKNILISIREHNLSAEKPFQVFGMEMTAMNYNFDWLLSYFKNADKAESLIDRLTEERTTVAFQQHTDQEKLSYWELYYELNDYLAENNSILNKLKGENSYQIALRFCEIVRQYATYISQDEFFLKVEFRDQFSTRNVLWCLDHLGEESKIAIWAHNGHVVKKSVLFQYDVLGNYLSDWFGEAYYSIGFTFNEGDFGAFGPDGFTKFTLPNVTIPSLTKDFDNHGSSFLLFDIRSNLSSKKRKFKKLFGSELPIRRDISESYNQDTNANPMMDIDLSNSYDCLIYIDHTNYPTTIDWEY